MRRTSSRKASTKAKLLNSIRPTERGVQTKLMELLEDRTLFSNLPAPLPTGSGGVQLPGASGSSTDSTSPSVTIDPIDPSKLVAVWSTHNKARTAFTVNGAYSTDGGGSWSGMPLATTLDIDPDTSATDPQKYNSSRDASVAFDRNNNVYVTFSEVNTTGDSGEILLQKFDFSTVSTLQVGPVVLANANGAGGTSKIVYQWTKAGDTAVEPMLAVDDNLASTDAVSTDSNNKTYDQTDPWSGNVYVAWATQDQTPTPAPTNPAFKPDIIRLIASSDGGNTFSSPTALSDRSVNAAQPRLVVSQGTQLVGGTHRVAPGQVSVVWDGFGGGSTDSILFDHQDAGAVSYDTSATGIAVALDAKNPNQPTTIPFSLSGLTDTRWDVSKLTDLSLDLTVDGLDVKDVTVVLQGPGGKQVTLFGNGNVIGNNFGVDTAGDAPVTFIDSAARVISENKGTGTHQGIYQASGGSLDKAFGGLTLAQVTGGPWQLVITNNNTTTDAAVRATLHLTSGLKPGGKADVTVTTTPIRGALNPSYPLTTAAMPDVGVGPAPVIAADNTLGAFSPYAGRMYIAYVSRLVSKNFPDSTVVETAFSDNGGLSWNVVATPPNLPSAYLDGISEYGRPQFQPEIAVDQSTGSVVVSMYDGHYDSARARVAMDVVASNDGGQSFSPASFANEARTAVDGITGQAVTLEPVPDNESAGNANRDTSTAFGEHQGLAVFGGKIYPVWSGNLNGIQQADDVGTVGTTRLGILTNILSIPTGPRVISSTLGAVGEPTDTLNNSRGTDGGPQAKSFIITFDRPVDPNSFDMSDVTVTYRDPSGNIVAGLQPTVTAVTPLGSVLSINDSLDPTRTIGSTQFRVDFTASSAVGTYSYSVGPNINDHISKQVLIVPPNTPIGPVASTNVPAPIQDPTINPTSTATLTTPAASIPAGEVISSVTVKVDLTFPTDSGLELLLTAPDGTGLILANGVGGSGANFTNTVFDDSAPTSIDDPTATAPFTGSFKPQSALSSLIAKDPGANGGVWTLQVVNTLSGVTGTINDFEITLVTGKASTQLVVGNNMDQSGTGALGASEFTTDTPLVGDALPLIVPGPHIVGSNVAGNPLTTDNLVLNGQVTSIDVTFDRDMDDSTISGADVLGITGPNGAISGPFGMTLSPVNADPAHHRTYRITFPAQQLSGNYRIELGSSIASAAGDQIDNNLNAGLDAYRGTPSAGAKPITYNSTKSASIGTNSSVTTTRSTIHVSDDFTVTSGTNSDGSIQPGVVVQINVTHPFDSDLEARLIGPDGVTSVALFNIGNHVVGGGNNHANFSNTIFDDNANTIIQNGSAPFFGRFVPQQPLSTFNGMNSQGDWTLEIKDTKPGNNGTLTNWSLSLGKPVSSTGLGQASADRSNINFRIQTMDVSNPQSSSEWTPLGPASASNTNGAAVSGAGRVSAIAVDPSDPSGNTVYVGGSGGGVWKTTNFLTHDAAGPNYIPLTDNGPTGGLSIGSIAVFARNNDPDQSIIFATTGDGNVNGQGVGILRSMDGGKTWVVLDSSSNFDASGNLLPLNSASRDHVFVGTTSFKIVVDPKLSSTGDVIVYAALSNGSSNNEGGIWRSIDSGKTWQRVRAGNPTDVVLDYNSAAITGVDANNIPIRGNLQILYAGFEGEGVFSSPNRGQTWNPMPGGVGNPLIQDDQGIPTRPVNVTDPASTPNGAKGRIVLARPALQAGNVAANLGYQGWLYAAVATPDGKLDGLYLTKDFGQNWTRIRLPVVPSNLVDPAQQSFEPTNDPNRGETLQDGGTLPVSSNESRGANYAMSLAVDPTNPNVVYLGGSDDRRIDGTGLMRIDTTGLFDPHNDQAFDSTQNDGGAIDKNTVGSVQVKPAPQNTDPTLSTPSGLGTTTTYTNILRDPNAPFVAGATLELSNVATFVNNGLGAAWIPFDKFVASSEIVGSFLNTASLVGSNQHVMITEVDPITGKSRLILGNDQGVFTVEDNNGSYFNRNGSQGAVLTSPDNPNDPAQGARNGNLQLLQENFGALQPSSTAATNVGSLVYSTSEGLGLAQSTGNILTTGNLNWSGGGSSNRAVDVQTDQQGNGTVYSYVFPSSAATSTDMFQVNGVSRTFGLFQDSQTGLVPDPTNWPYFSGPTGAITPRPGAFTVNPLDGQSIIMSSAVGRIFSTENQGLFWSVIANPADLDSTYVPVLTFGAPDPGAPNGAGNLNNYIIAGTQGGSVFVTFTGGGNGTTNNWINLTNAGAGLDGSAIQGIVADPVRGTHDIYAVTQKGVYFMADTSSANRAWVNITGALFSQTHNAFGDPTQVEKVVKSLTSVVADWRYSIPDVPSLSGSPTHPVLYVSADSGVYRSLDKGASWKLFPNQATDGSVSADGGLLPNVPVSDLDLSLGNIDPTTGQPQMTVKDAQGNITQTLGNDLLVASTFGRGSFGIRVAPLVQFVGLSGGGNVSNTLAPTITGFSEQSAYGNNVSVKIFDVTDPTNRVFIGSGTTDATGKFSITLNPGFTFGGTRVIAAQATDDLGAIGPDAKFTLTVNTNIPPKISIAAASLSEGNSGQANMIFTVTLDKASSSAITVNYATSDGTATTADSDYVAKTGAITFAAGTTSQQIQIPIVGDNKFESNETFSVTLSGASNNSQLSIPTATGTINNDDPTPSISIANGQVNEGNSGTTALNFPVTLSNPSASPIVVNFLTSDGTATTVDSDYQTGSGSLTFAAGETSKQISVLVNGDTKVENNETFGITLSSPVNATLSNSSATGTILNDDSGQVINISDVTLAEGNSSTTDFVFNVTLTQSPSSTVTVQYATADGTATVADNDYQSKSGTLTFLAGQTSMSVHVPVVGDTKVEANETFFVNLTTPTGGASIAKNQGIGTITNDDAANLPGLTISDVSKAEGNSGTTAFTFNVILSSAAAAPVTVSYATSNGTATSGSDYTATSSTLTFAAGETSKQITVNVNGDTVVEGDETFNVTLSSPSANATITKAVGIGTIQNDDSNGLPSVTINDVTQAEGNSGTTAFNFTVSLSAISATPVTVQFATADGTAVSTSDYQSNTGIVTFAAGETSKQVTILVNGDTTVESNETFFVNLSNASANANITDNQGLGTINNDDSNGGVPGIIINDVTQAEGNSGTTPFNFAVTLTGPAATPVTVNYSTANGSALLGSDYASASGTLTFAAGETSKQITVNVNGDTTVESNETFFVNLSGQSANATISDSQATGTILNDDAPAGTSSITVTDVSQNEGNSGTTPFNFFVSLDKPSATQITVQYATADGSATAGSDYTAASGTVTFAPGQTSQQVTVNVKGDTTSEPDELFFVNLSNATGTSTITKAQGVGTIKNDDASNLPSISINDVIAHEGSDPLNTKPFIFSVTLSAAAAAPVTVQYATADGTATLADNDYTNTTGTLTFAAGQTSMQISVPVVGDTKVEGDETFFVNLTNVSANATIADNQGMATVQNDDVAGQTPSKITINNVAKSEGNSSTSTTSFTFTVTLDHSQTSNLTVHYATGNGTASSSSDYTSTSGTLTFTPGQTSKTITVKVKGDTTQESDESFFVNLSSASSNGTITHSQGKGTIKNDDSSSSSKVQVVTDPTNTLQTALEIFGTSASDNIQIQNTGTSQGKSKVTINGSNKGTFSFTGSIIVFGQDGSDTIAINSAITRNTYLFGGDGNDSITGGGGVNFIMGEVGNDTLNGGPKRNVLIGGDGADSITGGAFDDLIVGGDVAGLPHFANAASIVKEWNRTDATYAQRVTHIQSGGGNNSINFNTSTVFSTTGIADSVTGGAGSDFFLVAVSSDKVNDAVAGETVLDTPPH